jgi:hypothetical protein
MVISLLLFMFMRFLALLSLFYFMFKVHSEKRKARIVVIIEDEGSLSQPILTKLE